MVPERISDTETLPPTINRRGIVTRSILVVCFLTASSAAFILNQKGAQPVQKQSVSAQQESAEEFTLHEIGELEEGTSLIGLPFYVHCKKEEVETDIPVCIERDPQTNDLIFSVDGKIFRNDELIPVLGGKATTAIESITCHNGECARLLSEANGHVDVPYELIRTIVPELATTTGHTVVAETNVTFVPKEGTMISSGQSAMNWIGAQFGKTKAADMTIKSVTFKHIPMARPLNQIARHP